MDGSLSNVPKPAILKEIDDKKATLRYLNPTSPGSLHRRAKIKKEIADLQEAIACGEQIEEGKRQHEENMRFLDGGDLPVLPRTNTKSIQAQQTQVSGPTTQLGNGFAAYAANNQTPFDRCIAPVETLSNYEQPSDLTTHWKFGAPEVTLQSSSNPAGDGEEVSGLPSSPSMKPLLVSPLLPEISHDFKKRRRSSTHFPGASGGNMPKSRRTTPSPAVTGTTTPSSPDFLDIPDNPDLFGLLGGNPKDHLRDMQREQKEQEMILQKKKEQELADLEFARNLANQEDDIPMSGWEEPPPPLRPALRAMSQSTLDQYGQIHHASSPKTGSAIAQMKPVQDPQQTLTNRSMKQDPVSNTLKQERATARNPTSLSSYRDYIDLGSDDEVNSVDSSSDVAVIEPSSWHDNGRRSQHQRNPPSAENTTGNWDLGPASHLPSTLNTNPRSIGDPSAYSNFAAGEYGALPNSSGWDSMARMGQGLAHTVRGAWNTVSSNFGRFPVFPGTNIGYGSSDYGQGLLDSSSYLAPIDNFAYNEPPQALAHSLMTRHAVNPYDPNNQEVVDRYIDRVQYLTNDPTRTVSEIKDLLENIRPDEELPPENREGTPEALTYPLMEHQKLGLAWLKSMEEGSNKGGILADDMGLGKTIQALALMVSRKSTDPQRKTTLIVAPVALMKQWEREIKQKIKPGPNYQLSTYVLHGNGRGASWDRLKTYDIVLTTFGTLATEFKRKEAINRISGYQPLTRPENLPLLGDGSLWYRVIIDEAQCIKNKGTKAAQGACALKSLSRWCLSGTPMQNSPSEIYSLILFLRIKPYNSQERFTRDLAKPLKSNDPDEKTRGMRKMQALLKAILLRRNKKSKIDGRPILTLPERTTEAQHAHFNDDEQAFYTALETNTQLQFNKYLKAGTVGRHYSNILVLLLRLRQACCHPHLIKDFGISTGTTDMTVEDLVKFAKELQPDVIARIIEQGAPNKQAALECPVCMDMTENATIFIPCGHNTCSECFTRISDPSQAIANGYEGGREHIKCPNCRGKIEISRVTTHSAFKKVHLPEQFGFVEDDAVMSEETDTDEDSSDDSFDSDLGGFVVADDVVGEDDQVDAVGEVHCKRSDHDQQLAKLPGNNAKIKGKQKLMKKVRPTLAQLKKEGARNAKSRKRYLTRLKKDWIPSAKIEKAMEILRAIQERSKGEKTIVFSQFTSLLDLMEVPIFDAGWKCNRYDGSMSPQARNEAVMDFTDRADCKIMLVSLKAGNAGLNLVAASQVIILDPFWNPYIEEQAIDRAHRIGQMRPVHVHRILIQETVEDRILALQEKKRELIESALDEKASANIGRLGTRELAFLFVSINDPFLPLTFYLTVAGRSGLVQAAI
ncbi:MAG: hypothetical protein LQ351_000991 [Letrouitia transgressa]|nr:MAG: hypothetical protein LQ351_000991 [Letrouitia transgressa]